MAKNTRLEFARPFATWCNGVACRLRPRRLQVLAAITAVLSMGAMSAVALSLGEAPTSPATANRWDGKALTAGFGAVGPAEAEVSPDYLFEATGPPAEDEPILPRTPSSGTGSATKPEHAPFSVVCRETMGNLQHDCTVSSTGYSGVVNLSCANLTDQLTCAFTPAAVNIAPGAPAVSKLRIGIAPNLRWGETIFQVVASQGSWRAEHVITWQVGSALDQRGSYYMQCPLEFMTILPGQSGQMTCNLISEHFQGPVTLVCMPHPGFTCTSVNVVNLVRYQEVKVTFQIGVAEDAAPGEFTLHVAHDGDHFAKRPVPYVLPIKVPDLSPPAPQLPPCETALPLNCYMDPSRIVPTQP
jgi:hypothetical protein